MSDIKQTTTDTINNSDIVGHISGRKLIKIHSKEDVYDENEYDFLDEWICRKIDLAITERNKEWKKEIIGLLRLSKTEWKALEDLIDFLTNTNK